MHRSRVLSAVLLATIAAANASAQQVPPATNPFVGDWVGTLATPSGRLRLSLGVVRDSGGALVGVLTSLDQGNARIPTTLTVHGDTLVAEMPAAHASFTGVITAAHDSLRGSFVQGMSLPLSFGRGAAPAALVRPQEPKPPFPYRVEEVAFESVPGVRLAGTVTMPAGPGPFPAVVFVTGSGPQDRDEEMLGHKPFLVIADHLARRGIAALRFDDRGFAKSTGSFARSTSVDFADDAEAALHFVQRRPGIARERVGIIGHSEGGLIAPIVAARSRDVAFIVLLAGPGLPGDSLIQLQRAAIAGVSGLPRAANDRGFEANRRMFAAMRAARDSSDMAARLLTAQQEMVATLPDSERADASRQLDAKRALLLSPWWRYFLSYDPRPTLRKVHVPVLALNGTLDLQVPYAADLPEIDAALAAGGNRDHRVVALPGLNHLFQAATTGDPAEYAKITETFSPAALEIIADWIDAHAGAKKSPTARSPGGLDSAHRAAFVPSAPPKPRLGEVTFPTSATGAAQRTFVEGVLYLHSFEYDSAAAAFRRAQQVAPRFAMAYWGEAMTYTHPVWNEKDSAAARGVLRRLAPTREARLALAPTSRERVWLDAVETLYADGAKASRDTAYARAMARLVAAYPTDVEAQAFYALSLLGLNQGDRDVASYMRAAAVVAPIFAAHPRHPGAAHYLIHAFDDPAHAPLGLPAARAYSDIAPSAPHAQHMTSHIFLALGMWDETVHANEVATGMRDSVARGAPWSCGHYAEWLQYAYLQQGRPRAAAGLVQRCRAQSQTARGSRARASLARMRAVQIAGAGDENGDTAWMAIDTSGSSPYAQALVAIGSGLAAARHGDAAGLRSARAALSDAIGESGAAWPGYGTVSLHLLDGLRARAAGDTALALRTLRRAAAVEDSLPVDFGPPPAIIPAHEVLGETLLQFARPAEAQAEFERQLARTPRRAASLVGMMRAATAAGDAARAAAAYDDLAAISRSAESGAPVRTQLARMKPR